MIGELAAGVAFLAALVVLVAQLTGWRPPQYPFGPARSWGAEPVVLPPVVPPPAPGTRSVRDSVERDMSVTGNAYLVREEPQRVEVVIRIEVRGPDA